MITLTWRPSGAPCDSCGQYDGNQILTLTLSNAKSPLGYRLPDLSLCRKCRYALERDVSRNQLLEFPGHPPPPKEPAISV